MRLRLCSAALSALVGTAVVMPDAMAQRRDLDDRDRRRDRATVCAEDLLT